MIQSRLLVLFSIVLMCALVAIEAAAIEKRKHHHRKSIVKKSRHKKSKKSTKKSSPSWSFSNWNSYKKATVGRGCDWSSKWGIPEHSGWAWVWKGADHVSNVLVKDPSGDSNDKILSVIYPKGSRNPEYNPNGGIGFKAQPMNIPSNARTVEFEYSVFFPKGFDFVKGIIHHCQERKRLLINKLST